MKTKSILLLLLCFITIKTYSQFDKPILQFGIGIGEPLADMKGTYYRYVTLGTAGFQFITPDTTLFTNNYGAKTGISFFGAGKINFDKYSIVRGVFGIGFNTFNSFESQKNGNIGIKVRNINNVIDTVPIAANFNYSFNNFNITAGLEIAPLAFTNMISPYFGARFAFNTFNAKLSYTSGSSDTTKFSANDVRLGVTFDAGIEIKFNKVFGIVLGATYNLGNLLLKNTNTSVADYQDYGKSNSSINDGEGIFYSGLYDPVRPPEYYSAHVSKKKDINWATFYLGLNLYLNTEKSTKKTPPKK